ncbi:hypothetical protein [Kingella kingae]|uniref:hypothetical protein n=1 Tax=Kingella kingae TaxID=504 RepID=UPI00040D5578|nr:hypothetical protein [Kingella kingae]
MIFIWGMAFFALVFSLPLFLFAILMGDSWIYSANYLAKNNDNNGYCRDLQHEIAAERKHNA